MTKIRYHLSGRDVRPLKINQNDVAEVFDSIERLNIHGLSREQVNAMAIQLKATGMDEIVQPITGPVAGVPIQFLQHWLPGFIHVATVPVKIDELVGITAAGRWEDEEVIQTVLELTGSPQPYGDYTDIPLSSWNPSYERRTIVRFEEGLRVGKLEEARAALANINSAEQKRNAATKALNIKRNDIGFYGYNASQVRTYGLLNDPNLNPFTTVATGDSGNTEWSSKTYLEITADIRAALSLLRSQSGDLVDPANDQITLAVASDAVDYLTITSDYGNSVMDWLKSTYPNVRVKSVPQFNDADGGENVFYLYAENVADTGTDDGRVFEQIVPTVFQMLGSEQRAKTYLEDYTNASAGIFTKRPYAVVRKSGI